MRRMTTAALVMGGLSLPGPPMAQGVGNPPAGQSPQQWYSICGPALQQAYQQGMGQGAPYNLFVDNMYRIYAQPVMSMPQQSMPMNNQCNPGATQCFSGWLRTCVPGPMGATWRTGAQRC